MWTAVKQEPLTIMRRHSMPLHQPTEHDRGTASSPRLAVHIDRFTSLRVILDERHRSLDRIERRRCEIDRPDMQL